METLAYVICGLLVVQVVLAVAALIALRNLRKPIVDFHETVERSLHYLMFEKPTYHHATLRHEESGFCIWVYRDSWQLEADYSTEGYEPGPTPTRKAAYDGQAIRQLSVKKLSP